MSSYDSIDVPGGEMQCFRPGVSTAAVTTLDLKNVDAFALGSDADISYDAGSQLITPFPLSKNVPIRPPLDAKTLTISVATKVAYMRKIKGL